MINENGESSVTVKKLELLDALKKNRAEHRAQFELAQKGYRDTVISELDKRLKEARAGKQIQARIYFTEPQDHTRDYDRVIRMVEMSVKEEISISETDFAKYVLDDWGWKAEFIGTSNMYNGSRNGE